MLYMYVHNTIFVHYSYILYTTILNGAHFCQFYLHMGADLGFSEGLAHITAANITLNTKLKHI